MVVRCCGEWDMVLDGRWVGTVVDGFIWSSDLCELMYTILLEMSSPELNIW